MALKEQQWHEVLSFINKKRCTPLIGAGNSVPWLPLAAKIAKSWTEENGYPLDDSNS